MAFLDKNSVFVPVCSLPFRWWNEAAQHSVGSFCITFWPSGKYPEIGERNVSSIMILHYSSSCIYLFPTFIFYLIVPPLQRHCFTTIVKEKICAHMNTYSFDDRIESLLFKRERENDIMANHWACPTIRMKEQITVKKHFTSYFDESKRKITIDPPTQFTIHHLHHTGCELFHCISFKHWNEKKKNERDETLLTTTT